MIVRQATDLAFHVKLTLDESNELKRQCNFGKISEEQCLKCIIEDDLHGSKDTDPER